MALTDDCPCWSCAVQDPVTVNGRNRAAAILTQEVSDAEKLPQIWDTVQRTRLMFNVSGGGDLNADTNLPGATDARSAHWGPGGARSRLVAHPGRTAHWRR